eukprot:scaffold431_cov334-Pavlova_lutheri.AAC.26
MVVVPFAHPFDEARFEIPAIPPVPAARIQLEKNPWDADATSKPIGRAQRVRFQAIGTLDRSTMARPSHTQGLGRRQHRSRELRDVLELEHSPVVTRSLPIRHDGEGVRDPWLHDDTTPRGGCPAQVCPIPMDVSIGQDDPSSRISFEQVHVSYSWKPHELDPCTEGCSICSVNRRCNLENGSCIEPGLLSSLWLRSGHKRQERMPLGKTL